MKRLTILAFVASVAVPLASSANFCELPLEDASAAEPHSFDDENDYNSLVDGRGNPVAGWTGDLYRESVDLVGAWLDYEDGAVRANVEVKELTTDLLPNATYYVLWTYGAGADNQRWASARLKGYGVAYAYGYMTVNPVTTNIQFATVGDTTGSVDIDANTIHVNLPAGTEWGSPESGSLIMGIKGESRVLVGSPEPLPENPVGFRHGLVYVADESEEWCLGVA